MANISIDKTKWFEKIKRWVSENKKDLRGLYVHSDDENSYLLYQSQNNSNTDFCLAKSSNGLAFELITNEASIQNTKGYFDNINKIINIDIVKKLKEYYMVYHRQDSKDTTLCLARSKNLISWKDQNILKDLDQFGIIIKNYKHNDNYLMYAGENNISSYYSKDLIKWTRGSNVNLKIRQNNFDSRTVKIVYGINYKNLLLTFYLATDQNNCLSLGLAAFSQKEPEKLMWRSTHPIWKQPDSWQNKKAGFIGLTFIDKKIISYWNYHQFGIYAVVHPFSLLEAILKNDHLFLKLDKSDTNPIISPNEKNNWEAFCTFNPAAIYEAGKVHLIYRAQGFDYISVLGYASSSDGITIDQKLDYPVYVPSEAFKDNKSKKPRQINFDYVSGGGYGGAEDPRITKIGDRVYMTYVAFDGYNPPRIALTSIKLDDFLEKRWLWERPVLISPPGIVNKNCIIFPEKVNGKFVIFHRIYPNILVDYVDDLNFDGDRWLEGQYQITPRPGMWDSKKIGAGAPPIKTKKGWLLIYQAVGYDDGGKYKIGAMLLDLNRPERVLYRSNQPILEPDQWYENNGFKPGVTYPCGAVVIEDYLYVYYGAADSHVCVAKTNLAKFINDLTTTGYPKLEPASIHKVL